MKKGETVTQYYIAKLRVANGWSQADVANQINITKAAYSNIETGKRSPSLKIALKLQEIFQKPIEELLQ